MPDGSPVLLATTKPQGIAIPASPGSALETMARIVLSLGAVRDANMALKLAGSNKRVKDVEESIDECLQGCAKIPKFAAEQLRKAFERDKDTGEVQIDATR
jgi:hypothetical protein